MKALIFNVGVFIVSIVLLPFALIFGAISAFIKKALELNQWNVISKDGTVIS